jgi:hypothetical protein
MATAVTIHYVTMHVVSLHRLGRFWLSHPSHVTPVTDVNRQSVPKIVTSTELNSCAELLVFGVQSHDENCHSPTACPTQVSDITSDALWHVTCIRALV